MTILREKSSLGLVISYFDLVCIGCEEMVDEEVEVEKDGVREITN